MDWYPLGPGDSDPLIGEAKWKLGVYPATDDWTDPLTHRIRGMQALQGLEQTGLLEVEVLALLGLQKPS